MIILKSACCYHWLVEKVSVTSYEAKNDAKANTVAKESISSVHLMVIWKFRGWTLLPA